MAERSSVCSEILRRELTEVASQTTVFTRLESARMVHFDSSVAVGAFFCAASASRAVLAALICLLVNTQDGSRDTQLTCLSHSVAGGAANAGTAAWSPTAASHGYVLTVESESV